MPEIKWIKISTSIFDDEKIQLIEAMPDADTLLVIWLKLLVLAGKVNASGDVRLSEGIAYTDEMLSTVFRRPLNSIRLALQVFIKFKMVETLPDRLFITNWEKYQNIEGMDKVRQLTAERVRKFRERQQPLLPQVTLGNVTVTQQREREDKKEKENKNTPLADKLNIYQAFEKYAKQILTPMISEELNDLEKEYGQEISIAAFKTASSRGKSGGYFLKYCQPILEEYKLSGIPENRKNGGNHGTNQIGAKKLLSGEELARENAEFMAAHPKRNL